MKAKYFVHNGMGKTEIEADSVSVIAPDGTEVELQFRRSDEEISLSINGKMLIEPRASNVVRVSRRRELNVRADTPIKGEVT